MLGKSYAFCTKLLIKHAVPLGIHNVNAATEDRDRIAACRVYQKEKYTDASAWEYYQRAKDLKHTDASRFMHEDTAQLLERWLELLKDRGEDEAFSIIRRELQEQQY